MGNNRQVILKIFRLDKNIYNELASEVSNFQIAIAIYISGFLFSGLAALNFLRNSLVYLEENLGLIVGTLPVQTVNELNTLIREFENVFDSIIPSLPWGVVSLVDLYAGFILVGIWIFYKEKTISALVWIFFLMTLGNLTTAIYVIYSLNKSKGNITKFFMGKNS